MGPAATPTATAERDVLRNPRRSIEPILLISTSDPSFSEGTQQAINLAPPEQARFFKLPVYEFSVEDEHLRVQPANIPWVRQGGGVEDLSAPSPQTARAVRRVGSRGTVLPSPYRRTRSPTAPIALTPDSIAI